MRYVIYARYSSENQNETSIDAQIRACIEYASRKGYEFVNTYIDRAKSAITDNRPAFQTMLADAETGQFDVVLVHKFDRFARDVYVHEKAKNALENCGVHIESVLEQLDDSPESVIMESISKGFAEYYSRNLSREVRKVLKEKVIEMKENGVAVHLGGKVPFGYDVGADRHYIINENEAAVVKDVFDLYCGGYGYKQIMQQLNSRGLRNKLGKPFTMDYVRTILCNEMYIGVYTRQSNPTNMIFKKYRKALKGKMQVTKIYNAVPKVITEEKFRMVEEIREENKKVESKRKAKEVYLLSGRIFCGNCGAAMVGNNNGKIAYYVCPQRKKNHACDMRGVNKQAIEEIVLNHLQENVNEDNFKKIVDVIYSQKDEFYAGKKRRLREIETEIAAVDARAKKFLDEIAEGRANDFVRDNLDELSARKAELKKEIGDIEFVLNQEDVSPDEVRDYVEKMKDIRLKDKTQQRRIIKSAVEKVVIHQETEEGSKKPTFTAEIFGIFGHKSGLSLVPPRGIEPLIQP